MWTISQRKSERGALSCRAERLLSRAERSTSPLAMRGLFLLVSLFTACAAQAQTFPPMGSGPFTWQRVGEGAANAPNSRVFAFSPGGDLYAGGRDPVTTFPTILRFVPAPGGPPAGTWRPINNGRQLADKSLLPLSADTLLYGHETAIYRTTDGGATSTLVHGTPFSGVSGGPDTPHAFLVLPPGHPHAGRILSANPPLYSDDRGASWTAATIPAGTESSTYHFALMPSGRILVATTRGVAASDDGGESYGAPVFGLSGTPNALVAFATPGSVQSGAPDCGLADVSQCGGAVHFGTSGLAPQGGAMLRTNDGGRTWSPLTFLQQPNDGIGSSTWAGVVALSPGPDGVGRGVAVGARGVVYTTRDGGVTWAPVGRMPFGVDSQPDIQLAMLLRLGTDGHLWVAAPTNSSRGWIYRSAEPAEAAFAVSSEAPATEARTLGVAVQPNPSRGRVSVLVSSAEARTVRVSVVDVRGREVAVVFEGVAQGERTVSVDTSEWPGGVYVVRAARRRVRA